MIMSWASIGGGAAATPIMELPMKAFTTAMLGFVGSLLAPSAMAAGYDGTRPFECTTTDIVSCTPEGGCEKETPEGINLPALLNFDVGTNQITGVRPSGEVLSTSIDNVRHLQDDLALQGVQNHVVWSVTVTRDSGDMMLAAMGDRIGYIAFGSCHFR
jgi:hypothetical protein